MFLINEVLDDDSKSSINRVSPTTLKQGVNSKNSYKIHFFNLTLWKSLTSN